MNNIELSLLNEESFVDERILDSNLDLPSKTLRIEIDGAALNTGNYLSKTILNVSDWYDLKVVKRIDDVTTILPSYSEDFLTSIIEFHYDGTELKLVGLGDHCWIEWIFLKPKITVCGEIDPT